jgi:hypothetical protein
MPRVDPPLRGDETTLLSGFLDLQRATMLRKVAGLDKGQLGHAAVPTTSLTLAGLIKHLALVEDSWLQEVFLGRELPEPWAGAPFDEDPDWEFTLRRTTSRASSSGSIWRRPGAAAPS